MVILNVDYWSFRLSLLASYVHSNIININVIQYFKKQKSLNDYIKQIVKSIIGCDNLLESTESIEKNQKMIDEKYDHKKYFENTIITAHEKIKDAENDKPCNKFDELKYFDDLEVQYKILKNTNNLIEINQKQIEECQRNILKYNSFLCEIYISRINLIKISNSVKELATIIDTKYYEKSWFLYPFVSRLCKQFWFYDLYKIEI